MGSSRPWGTHPVRKAIESSSLLLGADIRPVDNRLLASLRAGGLARIEPYLAAVELPLGEVLHEPGTRMPYVYFPVTAIVSLLYVMENGASAEIALIGNDGMLGIATVLGGESMSSRAVVQSAGWGFRMRLAPFRREIGRGGALLHLLLRYTQSLIAQMSQTAVCNRHHSIDQQLCRWLLMSMDRLRTNQLNMTQELIANMLGVRREGVTEGAGKLQAAGAIRYRRGRITVVDRPMLERLVCECYAALTRESDRLLSPAGGTTTARAFPAGSAAASRTGREWSVQQ